SRQTSIGIERLLTSDLTVSANYLFVHGVDLPRTVNVGLANAMFELQPAGESSYHGLSLAANRRLSHEIAWSASYTWSRALDTASDFDERRRIRSRSTRNGDDSGTISLIVWWRTRCSTCRSATKRTASPARRRTGGCGR